MKVNKQLIKQKMQNKGLDFSNLLEKNININNLNVDTLVKLCEILEITPNDALNWHN